MKQLVLCRHAKSSWKRLELADIDRPLSGRGKRDAPLMARQLKAWGLLPDLILSSPAKRARKTAKVVAAELDYAKRDIVQDERLYLQGSNSLLKVLAETSDSHEVVMLVGHNPDLTELAEQLIGKVLDGIPTAGVVVIRLKGASWRDLAEQGGEAVLFYRPEKQREA